MCGDIVLLTHLVASFHFAPLNLKNSSLYDLDKINQTSLKYFGSDLSLLATEEKGQPSFKSIFMTTREMFCPNIQSGAFFPYELKT